MKDFQDKYSWNLTDLFKNKEEFYDEIRKVKDKLKQIENYKGILCDNLYYVIIQRTYINVMLCMKSY